MAMLQRTSAWSGSVRARAAPTNGRRAATSPHNGGVVILELPLDIENARAEDADALLALRNHYIAHSFATFDETPLRLAAVRDWIAGYATVGPHRLLVARSGGCLLGFCSSQPYRAHPAFARTVETSVYVAPDAAGKGVGSALYERLLADLAGERLHRAVVGIALPNEASMRLHARFGFRPVGIFDEYAHKNGQAVSSQWMQRAMNGDLA